MMHQANYIFVCLLAIDVTSANKIVEDIDLSKPGAPTSLTPEDFMKADEYRKLGINDVSVYDETDDPLLKAKLFEGDIAGHNETEILEFVKENNKLERNAIRNPYNIWPRKTVPYAISSQFGPHSRGMIAKAIQEYHKRTCVKFVPRSSQRDYVYIYPGRGCHSMVGRQGGRQMLSLGRGCVQFGTIIHEFMHAVGFFHEQSRADRDSYVQIVRANIIPRAFGQFKKYSLRTIQHLGTKYDYGSIMHYGAYAFGRYGRRRGYETIRAIKSGGQSKIGNRKNFSKTDLYKIKKLYKCSGNPKPEIDEKEVITSVKCTDQLPDCHNRKLMGWCRWGRYTKYYCKRTCNLCSKRPKTTVSPPKPTTTQPPVTKSTQVPGEKCNDKKPQCGNWVKKDFCNKYATYMHSHCQKSCKFCGYATPPPPIVTTTWGPTEKPTGAKCSDANDHCESWRKKKYCEKYKTYMEKRCKKSCKFC